ncbi:unnamed protein product [Linum trigynum]|uniref:Uncharacterized protein n=1 Tax=Linum trigynum TaxID=586398 RepID=A0AAV2DGR7_9ROSI
MLERSTAEGELAGDEELVRAGEKSAIVAADGEDAEAPVSADPAVCAEGPGVDELLAKYDQQISDRRL